MKHKHPVITLFGSNSGNNVGDAAILSAILEVLTAELPGAKFLVPTTNPSFINNNYAKKYSVRAFNIMPWNLSFRFLGLPALKCLWKSDVALICDGIIFGKRLFNPSFNLLITLAPLALLAKLCRCKFVCYSVGIGPFPKGRGTWLARYLIQNCELIMMREKESRDLAKKIGVTKPIEITGDAAFINPVSTNKRAYEIAKKKGVDNSTPLLGINVTSYIDSWMNDSGKSSDPEKLIKIIAQGIKQAQENCPEKFKPLVFSTHPMDVDIASKLSLLLDDCPVISNTEYLSHDIQAVMALCSLFIGMRFHSLVLSSAVNVPIVALVYAPKVKGLMDDLKCPELALQLSTLTVETLAKTIQSSWSERKALLARQQIPVSMFKHGAESAAKLLVNKFFPELTRTDKSKIAEPKRAYS